MLTKADFEKDKHTEVCCFYHLPSYQARKNMWIKTNALHGKLKIFILDDLKQISPMLCLSFRNKSLVTPTDLARSSFLLDEIISFNRIRAYSLTNLFQGVRNVHFAVNIVVHSRLRFFCKDHEIPLYILVNRDLIALQSLDSEIKRKYLVYLTIIHIGLLVPKKKGVCQ